MIPVDYSRFRGWPALCLLICLSTCCANISVSKDSLVGTWRLTNDSRDLLPERLRHRESRFVLHDDGTFIAVDVPGEFLSDAQPWDELTVSGNGRWSVVTMFDDTRIGLDFLGVTDERWKELPYRTDLWPSASFQGLRLHYFRGDPDERIMIVFEKDTTAMRD